MRNLPAAQILLLLLVVVFGLVDLLARSIRKRAEEQQPPPPSDVDEAYEVAEREWGPDEDAIPAPSRDRERPTRAPVPAAEELAAAAARVQPSSSRPPSAPEPQLGRSRVHGTGVRPRTRWASLGPREARRAIVLMEILGQCRGLERSAVSPPGPA
jgi:hypothetical protein